MTTWFPFYSEKLSVCGGYPRLKREKEGTSATKSSIDCRRQAAVLAKNENNKVNILCVQFSRRAIVFCM